MAWSWPASREELIATQVALADERERAPAWSLAGAGGGGAVIGGCFVAFARGEAGPGHPGDRAWAGAVAWRPASGGPSEPRSSDRALRRRPAVGGAPRQAVDVVGQSVAAGTVGASYEAGLLALREGPLLALAAAALDPRPDVLLVDATGLDHPRRAGLAVHLGAVLHVPTVGVTRRPLVAAGDLPPAPWRRGDSSPLKLEQDVVGWWLCTRTGVRPIVVHAGWRTDLSTVIEVVLLASTEGARTPVPLQEARRVAREARALAGAG